MMKKVRLAKRIQNSEAEESKMIPEMIPEMMLRNNIRFFAQFINPKGLSPFSRRAIKKFVNEWNKELRWRGLEEEKI